MQTTAGKPDGPVAAEQGPTLKPHRNIQKPPDHGTAKAQKPAKRLCNPRTSLSRDRSLCRINPILNNLIPGAPLPNHARLSRN